MILQGYGQEANVIIQGLFSGPVPIYTDIVVENGNGVPGANSYVTVDQARTYAKARGKAALFANFEQTEQYLIVACDYLQSQVWKGEQLSYAQSLAWPRKGVYFNKWQDLAPAIPPVISKAQIEAALAIAGGLDIMPVTSGRLAIKETVGPISVEYDPKIGFGEPMIPIVDSLIAQYIGYAGFGGLQTIRV